MSTGTNRYPAMIEDSGLTLVTNNQLIPIMPAIPASDVHNTDMYKAIDGVITESTSSSDQFCAVPVEALEQNTPEVVTLDLKELELEKIESPKKESLITTSEVVSEKPVLVVLTDEELKLIQRNFTPKPGLNSKPKLFFIPEEFLLRYPDLATTFIREFKNTNATLASYGIKDPFTNTLFTRIFKSALLNSGNPSAGYLVEKCFNHQALTGAHILPVLVRSEVKQEHVRQPSRTFIPPFVPQNSTPRNYSFLRNGIAAAFAMTLTTFAPNLNDSEEIGVPVQEFQLGLASDDAIVATPQLSSIENTSTAPAFVQEEATLESTSQAETVTPTTESIQPSVVLQTSPVDISTVNQVPGQIPIHRTYQQDGIVYHRVENPAQYANQNLRVTTVSDPLIAREGNLLVDSSERLARNSEHTFTGLSVDSMVNETTVVTYMQTTEGEFVASIYLGQIPASTASLNNQQELEDEVIELDESDLIDVVDYTKFEGEQVAYTSAAGKTKNYQCLKVENGQMLLAMPNNPKFSFWVNISTLENENTLNAVKLASNKELTPSQVDFVQDSTSARVDTVLA
jgi:hypothetical protein